MRRDSHEHYLQTVQAQLKNEPRFQELWRGDRIDKVGVSMPDGLFLGMIKKNQDGHWRFYPEERSPNFYFSRHLSMDDITLTKIALKIRWLERNEPKGKVEKIHGA